MAKINLVPDVRLDKLKTKKRNFLATMTAIVILGVLVLFILILQGYKWSRVYSLDQTKKKISSTNDELKSYQDIEEMVINIEKGIKAVNEIEQKESKWSRLLTPLQQVTPNDIRFVELKNEGSKFTAKAQGRSVVSIARVINSLEAFEYKKDQKDEVGRRLFKNVNVESFTPNDKDKLLDFEITFELETGVLW